MRLWGVITFKLPQILILDEDVIAGVSKLSIMTTANTKFFVSMSDVKALFRTPAPPSFVDYNTLLSLGLVPYLLYSSP